MCAHLQTDVVAEVHNVTIRQLPINAGRAAYDRAQHGLAVAQQVVAAQQPHRFAGISRGVQVGFRTSQQVAIRRVNAISTSGAAAFSSPFPPAWPCVFSR